MTIREKELWLAWQRSRCTDALKDLYAARKQACQEIDKLVRRAKMLEEGFYVKQKLTTQLELFETDHALKPDDDEFLEAPLKSLHAIR